MKGARMEECPLCKKKVKKLAVYAVLGQSSELLCDDCAKARALNYWVARGADGIRMTSAEAITEIGPDGTEVVTHHSKARKRWWEFWK